MQTEIRIVNSDYELGFYLLETRRFPERHPVIVPGEAVISSQTVTADDGAVECYETIDLVVDINEDTSIATFANWLSEKLKAFEQKICSLMVAGVEIQIDEAEIMRALEEGIKEKTISHD
ncbi:MAG TPA: hypothetical protein VE439_05975 [Anaerolineae bacterium]|jgi:hypothetical protein|nr:hypothetical protein [Anaerolineae bacterium]